MPRDIEHKLIESIYGVTIDLDKYSDLLRLWEDEFLRPDEGQNAVPFVESHVQKASTILEMTQPLTDTSPSLAQVIEAKTLPTFILSVDGTVKLGNASALDFFDIKLGEKLPKAAFSAADMVKIEQYLQELDGLKADEILTIIQPFDENGEAAQLFALSKIHDVQNATDYLQISAVHIAWSANIGQVIQKSFGLSNTELDLARRYVAGERMADIALSKGRAVNTLKVQTKALYRKTKLNTQSELVRLFSALQSFGIQEVVETKTDYGRVIAKNHSHIIERPDGRKLYYEIYGDPKGEPVLFMHDIIIGTRMPANVISHLYARKIKLIAPHRAGYGHSDVYAKKHNIESFIADMQAVLAAEQVQDFKILSQFAGSVYGLYLCQNMPQRVEKIRMINSHVPISSKQQLAKVPMPNKVLVYTAIYMPQLMLFFNRIMAGQMKKFGARYVMNQYYKNSAFDLELCKDPEIAEIVMESLHHSFVSGASAITQTAKECIGQDWLALIADCKVPIEYFQAVANTAPLEIIREFVKTYRHTSLTIVEGEQLILYKYPQQIFDNF